MRHRWLAAPLAAAAVLVAACGSSSAPSAHASAPATGSGQAASEQGSPDAPAVTVQTRGTSKGTVLTNAQGRTLYWFAIDSPTASRCNGSCASVWPPVLGTAAAAPGTTLPHGFGTITRSGGTVQATYDGHPLYTYAGDTAAGQVKGNGLNASGGLWWAVTPSGAKLSGSPSGSSSSPATGGGYGY